MPQEARIFPVTLEKWVNPKKEWKEVEMGFSFQDTGISVKSGPEGPQWTYSLIGPDWNATFSRGRCCHLLAALHIPVSKFYFLQYCHWLVKAFLLPLLFLLYYLPIMKTCLFEPSQITKSYIRDISASQITMQGQYCRDTPLTAIEGNAQDRHAS